MAVLVVWYYQRSKNSQEKREFERQRRLSERRNSRLMSERPSRAKTRYVRSPVAGAETHDQLWSARKQRATHAKTNAVHEEEAGTIEAGFLGSGIGQPGSEIRDQDISKLDYVGFDEYISRQRASDAKRRSDASEELLDGSHQV